MLRDFRDVLYGFIMRSYETFILAGIFLQIISYFYILFPNLTKTASANIHNSLENYFYFFSKQYSVDKLCWFN